jgi:hypothetical protein
MRSRMATLVLFIMCLGCGRTAQEKYETALNIYLMEQQRLDKIELEMNDKPRDEVDAVDRATQHSNQITRVVKTKMMLEKADAAFYGD